MLVVGALTTDEGFFNHVAIEACICKTYLNRHTMAVLDRRAQKMEHASA